MLEDQKECPKKNSQQDCVETATIWVWLSHTGEGLALKHFLKLRMY